MADSYTSVVGEAKYEINDSDSRFIGITRPVNSEVEVETFLDKIRKEYKDSTHICYAFQLMARDGNLKKEKVFDDKEPAGSAGKPILNVIKNNKLSNLVVAVVRYKGSSLLGINGLVNAYSDAAYGVIQKAGVKIKTICNIIEFGVSYTENKILDNLILNTKAEKECAGEYLGNSQKAKNCRVYASEKIKILNQDYAEDVYYTLAIPQAVFKSTLSKIRNAIGRDIEVDLIETRFE